VKLRYFVAFLYYINRFYTHRRDPKCSRLNKWTSCRRCADIFHAYALPSSALRERISLYASAWRRRP